MGDNRHRKADPEEARRLYEEGWRQDDIARKLGVSPSSVGRYLSGGSRSRQFHQLVKLAGQANALAMSAETLTGHQFSPNDLIDAGNWDEDLTRLIVAARHLRIHLRTLTDKDQ